MILNTKVVFTDAKDRFPTKAAIIAPAAFSVVSLGFAWFMYSEGLTAAAVLFCAFAVLQLAISLLGVVARRILSRTK